MTRKKGSFLTFVFSLMPGAGEMYMGFMKQGMSLMALFFLTIFLAGWLGLGPLLFVLPVIWFYSFFHVHNLNGLPDEEFYAVEDDYLFQFDTFLPKDRRFDGKTRTVAAIVLIVIGSGILWEYMADFLYWVMPSGLNDHFRSLLHNVPQMAIAVLLILGGIYLVNGKKRQLDNMEEKRDGDL